MKRWLFAVLTVALVLVGATPAAADKTPGPVVLVGTGGLRWDDVEATHPQLSALREDAIGVLAVRSVRTATCPADGWLAVSAGRRAADVESGADTDRGGAVCRQLSLDVPAAGQQAEVPGWADYRDAADAASFDAQPGLLGRTLQQAGVRTAAVGPGAAIALAVPSADGRQATASAAWAGGAAADGTINPADLSDDVDAALATNPGLLVVDAGTIRDPDQRPEGDPAPTGPFATSRAEQVTELDTRLALVLGSLPANATVIVASLADAGNVPQLRLIAARGPAPEAGPDGNGAFAAALLGSSSTRQDGIVQSTDITPTLLDALGVEQPAATVGTTIRPIEDGDLFDRIQRLDDVDAAATSVRPIVPWFFNGLIIAQVLLYGVATLLLRRHRGEDGDPTAAAAARRRTLRILRRVAVVFSTVPAATFLANLVPWWRGTAPGLSVTVVTIAFVLPIAMLALLGPWRDRLLGPAGIVGGVTAAVLAADALTGSHLILSSLMGVQPVVAGRWYGFSQPAFALFATGSLLLALAVADRLVRAGRPRAAAASVAVIGLVATVIDGTPGIGSDFGGPPAIVPAFGVLALMVMGVRVTWLRGAYIAVGTVAVVAALSVVDWLRPANERTHLGRFVETVVDGGAWPVIQRKAMQNLDILFTSWLSALLPFAVAFVVLVLARPVSWGVRPLQQAYDRSPVLKSGMIAFIIMLLLGFALNDSGTVVPAVAATVAIPLLIASSVRALELDDEERGAASVPRSRRPSAPRR